MDNNHIFQLQDRLDRLEQARPTTPVNLQHSIDWDRRIIPAKNIELISSTDLSTGNTKVAIKWIKDTDREIDRFEVWITRNTTIDHPYLVASVNDSPASFIVASDADTVATAYVRTVMKNGLCAALNNCPAVSFNIYA